MTLRSRSLFTFKDPFLQDVRARAQRYFRFTQRSQQGGFRMQLKCALICTWAVASYISLLWLGDNPLGLFLGSFSLGLAIASIGMAVQHDGAHGAASRYPTLNNIWASTLDLIGGSSYFWKRKHNGLHHTYVNVDGMDDDINNNPLCRLSPNQPRLWFHRYQHFYLWFFYPLMAIKWHLFDDWISIIRGKIGNVPITRPHKYELMKLVFLKGCSYGLLFGVPLLMHGWLFTLLAYLISYGTAGFVLSVIFQLAHVVEESVFLSNDVETRGSQQWGRHQTESTIDFGTSVPGIGFFTGGLNYQIEHHLFPEVCHIHYARLARIVRRAAERHGVKYRSYTGMITPLILHYRHLRALGTA